MLLPMRPLLALVVMVMLAACSSGGSSKKASPTTTSTATSVATTTTAPGPPNCTTAGLNTSLGQGSGAAGTEATPILFQNTSGATCVLVGYPGVAGLDSSGNQVAQAERTPRGMIDGLPVGNDTPPVVTLTPGATASAMVESSGVPTGTATTCPTFTGLLVTPPNETHSVQLKVELMVCSRFAVHPVQPGSA